MLKITHELLAVLDDGKIFTVSFTKRTTGQPRTMNCRRGVQHDLVGAGKGYDDSEKQLMTVWSLDSEGYRTIPLDAVHELKHHGGVLRG